jgi:PHD/YefM family antitoxin component YafN of YafNO toxin-antitoxin module
MMLPLAESKAYLSEIVDRVEHEHHRVASTRNDCAAAITLSLQALEAPADTPKVLSIPATLNEIDRARHDVAGARSPPPKSSTPRTWGQ